MGMSITLQKGQGDRTRHCVQPPAFCHCYRGEHQLGSILVGPFQLRIFDG